MIKGTLKVDDRQHPVRFYEEAADPLRVPMAGGGEYYQAPSDPRKTVILQGSGLPFLKAGPYALLAEGRVYKFQPQRYLGGDWEGTISE